MKDSKVNICRPGYGASCSLCCGSHNYKVASRHEIEALFSSRREMMKGVNKNYLIKKIAESRSDMTGSYYFKLPDESKQASPPPLFGDCPQCPFVGYIDDDATVGCLINSDAASSGSRVECFKSYSGKTYFCNAREELTDEEILFAAQLAGDWYYYSILIHEGTMLRDIVKKYKSPHDMPVEEFDLVKRTLDSLVSSSRVLHCIHTYFY